MDRQPETFSDWRGTIRRMEVDGIKFNVLTTKKGALRSGDLHPNTQFNIILAGAFELTLRQNDKDVVVRKEPGELIIIPPKTPHLYRCLEDSVMLEWWDGQFSMEYYPPYRKFVEEQFKNHKK